jgi:methylmalonyl-CoA mutase N-terminal domain/subunit
MPSRPRDKGSASAEEVAAGEAAAPSGNGADGQPAAEVEQTGEGRALPASEEISRSIAPVVGPDDERVFTDSGIEIEQLYEEGDVAPGLPERLGEPGDYPFTRGIHPEMYRSRLWTMRQYAGFATPEDTNERYRYLIEHGSTGLSMAFDLPTQLGRDSDDPMCLGEVGRTGVPIDTIEDMRICFDQIPLDEVSTSMTINAPAAILLLLYELVGEEQDVPASELRGTVQNDVLKEYVARGNYIYPPEPTMRLTTDIFEYCQENVPKWNTISISGYHIREKGCSAVQEVAFTLSNAIAYVEAALARGLQIDEFAGRLAFFFNCHNNVFQEIAKFRAVRRMWAKIMRERFGASKERSQMIRFHTQTGGVTLQAQQPEVNIIRVALQGFAAVCGGTQSLHTNGFDEALALPTERSARIALRTQQVIAHESGAADTVDPFAGSYFIENLTDEIEERSWELIDKVSELGGSVEALDFIQREIEESAASYHERYRTGQDIIVGVNKYVTDTVDDVDILRVDPESEQHQLERLRRFKENRDQAKVDARLEALREIARGEGNLLYPIKDALRDDASIGEVCNAMRDVFGEYRGGAFF